LFYSHLYKFSFQQDNQNHNDQRQTTCIKSWHPNHPIFHIKLKNLGRGKKKHTCERDLVRGPVATEVVVRPAEPAPLEAKHLLPRTNHLSWTQASLTSAATALGTTLKTFIGKIWSVSSGSWANRRVVEVKM
jgi:hypothetical protein